MRLEKTEKPIPKNGEVLVHVKTAGICSSDLSRIYGDSSYHYPIILGHEFSGVTEEGRRVGVFPLLPCHKCKSCLSGHYETCSHYGYLGSRQDGAFAEVVAVPKWNLIDLPDSVTFEEAALIEPAAVALHAVRSIQNLDISKAAVVGDGAIGRLVGAWLTSYGVGVVDVLGRNDKGDIGGYDVCVEAVGSSEAFRRCVKLTKPNGEMILVGNPAWDFRIDQKLYWNILRMQISIKGVWNASYPSDWNHVLVNIDDIRLASYISHKFEFDELDKALKLMYDKQEKYEKVIVTL